MHNELIESMADVFALATTGFEEFYKEAEKQGDKSALSGDRSASASSGDHSKSASSGYRSKSASSGDYNKSASSGYRSKSASSGYLSISASSGTNSKSASSGDFSKSASSGFCSASASSGDHSKSASSGANSKSASSGDHSKSASSGDYSRSVSSGDYSQSVSSGENSTCVAVGYRAAVKGDLGNLLMVSEYANRKGKMVPIGGKADIIDGVRLKPDCWYIVEKGEWAEVDFSDGMFTYVISAKGSVKKVRTEQGEILYLVRDEAGNAAHGKTVKEARADLVYKITTKFDGTIPSQATGKEWVGLYRAITGACAAGVRGFVEKSGKSLDQVYMAQEIAGMVRGHFGADKFASLLEQVS